MKKDPIKINLIILLSLISLISSCGFKEKAPLITAIAKYGAYKMIVNAEGEIEAKKNHVIQTPRLDWQPCKISWLIDEGSYVQKGDTVVLLESESIQNNYINARDELELARSEAKSSESKLELDRIIMEAQLKGLESRVNSERLRLDNLKYEPPLKQQIEKLEIEKLEIDLKKIQNKLESLKKIQDEEKKGFQLKIKLAKTKLERSLINLSQLAIAAPVEGIVKYSYDWGGNKIREGSQLNPNQWILEIPDLSRMQVKLQLGESDAQKCHEGDSAYVSIRSLNGKVVTGEVIKVDKIAKPIRRDSKIKKIEVVIGLDSLQTELKPGLSAYANITVNEVDSVFLVPQDCIFDVDSTKVVYAWDGDSFNLCQITIKNLFEDFAYIKGNIKPNTHLALKMPDISQISNFEEAKKIVSADTLKAGI